MKSCAIALTAFSMILLFWGIVLLLVLIGEISSITQSASISSNGELMSSFPLSLFSSAFGAAFGAGAAYLLGVHRQESDLRNKRHAALLRTYYALISQWSILEGIRKGFLEKNRSHPERFLRMPEYRICAKAARVPLDDIAFIGVIDDANILQEIHIAELGYDTGIMALDQWNERIHNLHTSPLVDIKSFDMENGASRIEAPIAMMFFIKKSADILYDMVDEGLVKLITEIRSVEALTKRLFPGMKALRLVPHVEAPKAEPVSNLPALDPRGQAE